MHRLCCRLERCRCCLVPKPSKAPTCPANLRPLVCCPSRKAIAAWLRSRLDTDLAPHLPSLPQHAYTAGRSACLGCIRTSPEHSSSSRTTSSPSIGPCFGGITLSVDHQGAFNEAPRDTLHNCLAVLGVDRDTIRETPSALFAIFTGSPDTPCATQQGTLRLPHLMESDRDVASLRPSGSPTRQFS